MQPIAQHFLDRALAAFRNGDARRASGLCGLGLENEPEAPVLLHVLALCRWSLGDPRAAADILRRLVERIPDQPRLFDDLGGVLAELGAHEAAFYAWERALSLDPRDVEALLRIAARHLERGEPGLAEPLLERAAALTPDWAEPAFRLGHLRYHQDRQGEAVTFFRRAVRLAPGSPQAHTNLGVMLRRTGALREAVACHERALALDPGFVEGHWNLSHVLLALGDLRRGFAEAEWRLRKADAPPPPAGGPPLWDGAPLDGRRILLTAEQGIGDVIHFARFAAVVASRGGRVVLECHPGLERVMATVPGVESRVTIGRPPPPVDCCAPLLSVPFLLGLDWDGVPVAPYLGVPPGAAPPPEIAAADGLKIGIVWSGNPEFLENRDRAVPLPALAPLAAVEGVRLFSLQKGGPAEALARADAPAGIVDLGPRLSDFADTAAAIAALDLVISADTSVPNLAGAMGAPTWTLLGYHCDWRWMRDREDCPWYPSMRLFRQPERGDWTTPVARLADALRARR